MLLKALLHRDPELRASASEALGYPWFRRKTAPAMMETAAAAAL